MGVSAIFGQVLLGWLLADLLSGAFHWWEDRFGNPDWPLIGPWIIAPNRLHHEDPLAFTRHGFLARNKAAFVVAALTLVALGLSPFSVSFAVGVALANEVHRYAHQPSAGNGAVHVLQKIGLMQSSKEHAVHHRPPFERNYCVMTDWLNPLLEAGQVWHRAERLLGRA